MQNFIVRILATVFLTLNANAQDTSVYKLRLSLPLLDLPQNYTLANHVPSMQQALDLSNDFYELSFWGIDALGDKLFIHKSKNYTKGRKIGNAVFKYGLSLAFSKFGSELPIPLGIWGHEEFHRSVLGLENIASKNGNWLLNRWDGTVYGISDEQLTHLKQENNNSLLYSYVSGVHYEIALNQNTSLNDFYQQRSLYKNALLLYNAYYVYNYFRFSTSALSDSVKMLAPPHESKDPTQRDFAGADLTAWVYDMFNPNVPYDVRDSFPGGEGVNRRIGFSDLSFEGQAYLKKQKTLSLLNFINPAIFFIPRISINEELSFNFFTQYTPTHFGNDLACFLPVKFKEYNLLLDLHRYSNKADEGFGIGIGLFKYRLSEKSEHDLVVNVWNQPKSFYDDTKITGGQIELVSRYFFNERIAGFLSLRGKTKGWILSNPYLDDNFSIQLGFNFHLIEGR